MTLAAAQGEAAGLRRLDLPALDALPVYGVLVWLPHGALPLAGLAGLVDWRLCGTLSRHLLAEGGQPDAPLLVRGRAPLAAQAIVALGLKPASWRAHGAMLQQLRRAVEVACGVQKARWALAEPALGGRYPADDERALQATFADALQHLALPADWLRVGLRTNP